MWKAEQVDEGSGGDSLASQASHICEPQVQRETLSQKIRWIGTEKDGHQQPLASTLVCTQEVPFHTHSIH